MTADTKQYIQLHLSFLKEAMKKEGLIFAVATRDGGEHNPKICLIDKGKYMESRKLDGIMVSLQDLNNGLI